MTSQPELPSKWLSSLARLTVLGRPIPLVLLVAGQLLLATGFVVVGLFLLYLNITRIEAISFETARSMFLGSFVLILGCIAGGLGLSLWRQRAWAYYVEIIFAVLAVIGNIGNYATGGDIRTGSLITNGIVLALLLVPNVRRYFTQNLR